jgi:hypothetical protein
MKTKTLVLGLAIVVFFVGCGGSSPSVVAKNFYAAIEKNDAKKLAQYATPETVAVYSLYGSKLQGYVAEQGKITDITEEIDGDTATVFVTFENGDDTTLDLIKVDGKWKVNLDLNK